MAGRPSLNPDDAQAIRNVISYKVHKFLGTRRRKDADDDLEQDLAVRVWECLPKHNPERSSLSTFVSRLVDTALLDLRRRRRARKRRPDAGITSLQQPVRAEGDAAELWQTLPADQQFTSVTGGNLSAEELAALRQDLESLLATMSPEGRSLSELMMHGSVTEAAHELGINRGTVYRRWRAIAATYQDHSLKEYLK